MTYRRYRKKYLISESLNATTKALADAFDLAIRNHIDISPFIQKEDEIYEDAEEFGLSDDEVETRIRALISLVKREVRGIYK